MSLQALSGLIDTDVCCNNTKGDAPTKERDAELQAFKICIDDFVERYKDQKIDVVAGVASTCASVRAGPDGAPPPSCCLRCMQALRPGASSSARRSPWRSNAHLCRCASPASCQVHAPSVQPHMHSAPATPLQTNPMLMPCTRLLHAGKTIGASYKLEYGEDRIEMHLGHVTAGQRVVLIDDLIATGGTLAAGISLIHQVRVLVRIGECGAAVVHRTWTTALHATPSSGALCRVRTKLKSTCRPQLPL